MPFYSHGEELGIGVCSGGKNRRAAKSSRAGSWLARNGRAVGCSSGHYGEAGASIGLRCGEGTRARASVMWPHRAGQRGAPGLQFLHARGADLRRGNGRAREPNGWPRRAIMASPASRRGDDAAQVRGVPTPGALTGGTPGARVRVCGYRARVGSRVQSTFFCFYFVFLLFLLFLSSN